MKQLKRLLQKYREQISYLFFGGLATVLNFIILNILQVLFGLEFAAGAGNVLNNAICILFAYWTNRTFVFQSKSTGAAARKEFLQFVGARIGTAVLDQLIMWLGVTVLGGMLFAGNMEGPPVLNIALIGSLRPAQWANLVKLFSQVVVIVSNYVFSKLFIFKK